MTVGEFKAILKEHVATGEFYDQVPGLKAVVGEEDGHSIFWGMYRIKESGMSMDVHLEISVQMRNRKAIAMFYADGYIGNEVGWIHVMLDFSRLQALRESDFVAFRLSGEDD